MADDEAPGTRMEEGFSQPPQGFAAKTAGASGGVAGR